MRVPTAAIAAALAASPALAQTPSFTLIDPLPGQTNSRIFALSADGRAAAGESYSFPTTAQAAFRWTSAAGRFDIGSLPGVPPFTSGRAISGDGQYVAGYAAQDLMTSVRHAYRWSSAGGFQDLGTIPGYQQIDVTGANGGGSVLVGHVQNGGVTTPPTGVACRWTSSGGFQAIPYVRPGSDYSEARGVSRDGNIVVGVSAVSSANGPYEAFRWSAADGIQPLRQATGSPFDETYTGGISGNGSVIVGSGYDPLVLTDRPFRWTAQTGMVDMGLPPGASGAEANLASFDGSLIVGSMEIPGNQGIPVPFVWSSSSGYSRWTDYVTSNGVVLPLGFTNYTIASVSDDGMTFAGYTFGPNTGRAFVATIPSPNSAAMVLAGLCCLRRRRRA
jgi:probable HAF family extracellular repeat protein